MSLKFKSFSREGRKKRKGKKLFKAFVCDLYYMHPALRPSDRPAYVQNAPGILVRPSRQNIFLYRCTIF